jgi:hypothetical protein
VSLIAESNHFCIMRCSAPILRTFCPLVPVRLENFMEQTTVRSVSCFGTSAVTVAPDWGILILRSGGGHRAKFILSKQFIADLTAGNGFAN